jgi:hypothetical protein
MNNEKVTSLVEFMKMRVNPENFVRAYNKYSKTKIELSEKLRKVKTMKVTKLIYEIVCDLNNDYKKKMEKGSGKGKKKGGAELFTFTNNDNLFYLRNVNQPITDTSIMNDMSWKSFTPQLINTYSRM